ncbi:FbpB family small basic protein [Oceanobacillus arenosus]|uniref:FbpB family small basic protein n=1 Tax=Oceanobacillus arenosus TaxID=1229153 RepID=A0A3D8PQI4_9BACI|nr:FbpB family small basic protein [Oceanobacillus arenosus]RDW18406.1 FbpB family small basic protein [Oceanobacillus arenosus]
MRPRALNFDQLVKQNKQELLEDEKKITQIELRLEKKHRDLVSSGSKELK